MTDNFENDNLNNLPDEQMEEAVENEEYVKIEIDSVTEENENGEIVEILDTKPEKKKSVAREVLDWVLSIAVAIGVVALINMFVFVQVTVDGISMEPNLQTGDRLIATRFMYEPQVGDIVVVQPFLDEGTVKGKLMFGRTLYIKRVIAVGGQTIDIKNNRVYIDGELLEEEYIPDHFGTPQGTTELPAVIPENHVFVMGDNRQHSRDSRDATVGIIRNEQVVGKANFRIFPFNKFGVVK